MGLIQTGIVTGKRIGKNKDGTKEVLLLQVEMADPEDIQTVELMSQTGENSNPPVGSRVLVVGAGPAFKLAIASDDSIVSATADGEKIIYSTSADGKTVASSVYLKNDGTIIAKNGTVTITADAAGKLTAVTDGNTEITSAKTIINNDVDINGVLNINFGGNTMSMGGATFNMGNATISGTNVYNGATSEGHRHDTSTDPSGVPQ